MSYDQGSYRDIMTKDARICTVRHGYVSRKTYHANSRLIAAAPTLLKSLERLHAAVADRMMSASDGMVRTLELSNAARMTTDHEIA
jgi:hypothetical protein